MNTDEKVVEVLLQLVRKLEGIPPFQKQLITDELKSDNGILFSKIVQGGKTGISADVLITASELENTAPAGPQKRIYDQITQSILTTQILQMETQWDDAFEHCSTETAKELSHQDRTEGQGLGSLMYGEVAFVSFAQVLWSRQLIAQHQGIFYDLGSGTGRALVAASMLQNFRKLVGIELLPSLHVAAQDIVQRYESARSASAPRQEIVCVCGSFLDVDWSDGDVVFANSTCFDDRLMQKLALKAKCLKRGAIFISMTKRLESPLFKLIWTQQLPMSWGNATVYAQRRVAITPESFLTNGAKHGDRARRNTTEASVSTTADTMSSHG